MTEAGFKRIVALLEGVFLVQLTKGQRDAWWEALAAGDDQAVHREALAYVQDRDRCRFGFPKPGDLLVRVIPQDHEPAPMTDSQREEHRRQAKEKLSELRAILGIGGPKAMPNQDQAKEDTEA